jgi:diguanylate cyclase (GGDEF)-like protein/PAS domain S-box-containing protein
MFVVASLRQLDQQTWRAIKLALGFRRRDALLKSIVDSSTDSILCIDAAGVIRTANPAASALFDCPLRALLGTRALDFIDGLSDDDGIRAGLIGAVTELAAKSSSRRRFPVEVSLSRIAIDDEQLYTAIIRDVSERREQQNLLQHQATHDSLTQLPNRAAVSSYLNSLLSRKDAGKRVAMLMVDLCRFKEVNDTLGHDVGDDVLREVARRFRESLTGQAFIGRIGGDEFTVVVPEVDSRMAIDDLSEQLAETLKRPIQVRGISIEVGLSIGIALWPDHARDPQELLRHADVAMYVAKRRNHTYEYYAREHDQNTVRRLSMVSDLRAAVSRGEINLLYQPQVDLATGLIASAEALMRWQHPVHGAVSPAEFIAIAESTDIIEPLTEWTVAEVLKQMQVWDGRGLALRVAVNLSARTLQDVEFPSRLHSVLQSFGVDPARLELEITETAMMLDPKRARCVVRDLQGLGVRIAIDDYGTGFSSLGYVRDLNVQALKLDQSFVTHLESNEQDRVIVESTAHMAAALGIEVVAEGVETEWVSRYLREVGYNIGQGYWFGRPMDADAFEGLVATGNLDRRRNVG